MTLIGVLIIVAGVSYSSWILEFVLPLRLNPATSFLSELSTVGKPYRVLFQVADGVTGTPLIVAAVLAWIHWPRQSRLITTGWVALAVFGVSTIIDAVVPLTCVPKPPHRRCVPPGMVPQLHSIHALTSTIAVNALYVAMVAFTLAAWRCSYLRTLRTWGLAAMLACATGTAWMLIADNLTGDYALGIAQRLEVGAMSLWLVILGSVVARLGGLLVLDRLTMQVVAKAGDNGGEGGDDHAHCAVLLSALEMTRRP